MDAKLIDSIMKQNPYTVVAEPPTFFLWQRIQKYSIHYMDTPLYVNMSLKCANFTADKMNKAYRVGSLETANMFFSDMIERKNASEKC